ncbi:hypothetical protein HW132_28640 [Brasilonema sp. CT11]|nr:hypothetical protein [Brasilonema sp. CT11]
MTIINLQELAAQLEQTAKAIEAKVKGTETRFNISADKLVKKVPELKVFGNKTVFQARWQDESMRIEIPRVCKSYEAEEVVTQLPDLDYLEVEYISYVTGLGGYAIVEIDDHQFQIGLTANLDLDDDELDSVDGEGEPPIEVLGYEKRPEIPLRSDSIPLNKELIVIANGKKSREHNTQLCDVKITETGEIIKNVICNTQLERLIQKYGTKGNCKFKVTRKTKAKEGKSKVSILDLNGLDFSDLEV